MQKGDGLLPEQGKVGLNDVPYKIILQSRVSVDEAIAEGDDLLAATPGCRDTLPEVRSDQGRCPPLIAEGPRDYREGSIGALVRTALEWN